MKPLTVDAVLRSTQQKGTDPGQKPVSGAFLNSGKAAAGTLAAALGRLLPLGQGKETAAILGTESRRDAQARVQDLLTGLKLKFSPQNDLAVRALMSEGLPLTLKLVQTVGRIQRKFPVEEAAAARIASRAIAAGMDPESAEMDGLWAQFFVADAANDAGYRGSGQREEPRGRNPDSERDADKTGILASELADLCIRAFKNPGMRDFCRPGPLNKAWIHVPFAFTVDSVEFSGIFRILYNYSSGISECLAADIKKGAVRSLFCVSGRGESLRLRFGSDRKADGAALKASLAGQGLDVQLYPSPDRLDEALLDMPLEASAHV